MWLPKISQDLENNGPSDARKTSSCSAESDPPQPQRPAQKENNSFSCLLKGWAAVWAAVWDAVCAAVSAAVWDAVCAAVSAAVWAAVWDAVCAAVWAAV